MQLIVASFYEVNLYILSLVLTLSFLWGGFVFFKRSIEEHFDETQVLDVVVLSGFFSLIVGRIIYFIEHLNMFWGNLFRVIFLKTYPGISPWGVLAGIVIAIYLVLGKERKKIVDLLDHAMVGVVSGIAVLLSGWGVITKNWVLLVLAGLAFIFFIVLWKMEGEYRTFEWYRYKKNQAKSGLIAGFGLSFYAAMVLATGLLSKSLSVLDAVISLGVFVGGFVLLYIRSGRVFGDDIKIIMKNGRKK